MGEAKARRDAKGANGQGPTVEFSQAKLPRLGQNPEYVFGADRLHHAERAVVMPDPFAPNETGSAVAHLANVNAIEYVERLAGGAPDEGAETTGAHHIDPGQFGALARNIDADLGRLDEGRAAGLKTLRTIVQNAGAEGKSLILLKDHPDISDARLLGLLQQELNHELQFRSTGRLRGHLKESAGTLLSDPLGGRAFEALTEDPGRYRFRFLGSAAAEIGERLMRPGGYRDLNLTSEEGRKLGGLYVQLLRKEYGDEAISGIADRVRQAFERR